MTGRAGEVHGLLDALDIDRSWLCCHSTGCGIGFAAAAAQSERIIGLVFVSPWSFGDAHLTTMQNLRVAAARGLNPYRYAWFNASLLFPPDYRREHHTGFEEMAQSARRRRETRMPSKTDSRRSSPLMPARRHEASNARHLFAPRKTINSCLSGLPVNWLV